jgi:uncharacterized protein YdcH (DUF465 family)
MDKHDLHHEFPEFEDRIHDLKTNDNHFRKLFDEYHNVNKDIHRIESNEVFTDSELNVLRSRRVNLKDEIYLYLEKAQ